MATLLKDLQIDEVSSVSRGAGEGVQILLMKRDGEPEDKSWLAWVAKHVGTEPAKLAAGDAQIDAYLKRDFSDEDRKRLAASGAAMPDGGYPIETKGDLHNAVQAFGRAKNKAETKAHIISRARALGALDALPDDWNVSKGVLAHVSHAARALLKSAASIIQTKEPVDKAALLAGSLGEFEDHLAGVIPGEIEKAAEAAFQLAKDATMTEDEIAKAKAEAEKAKNKKPDGKTEEEDDEAIKARCKKAETALSKALGEIALLKMSDKHKEYMDAADMDADERKAFADKTPDERDEHMSKNPIEKSLPASITKALAQAEEDRKVLKALQEKDEVLTFAKRATEIGLTEAQGETLRKAYRGDADAIKKLEQTIKGLNEQIRTGAVFKEFGTSLAGGDGTAHADLLAKAAELRKNDPKLSEASAFTKVYTDPANRDLKKRFDAEEAKRRAA